MVSFKFCFLFAALFLVSVNSLPNQKQELAEGSILDVIKKVVHFLENLLDKVLSIATDAVNNISDNWEEYRTKILDTATKVITAALQSGRQFLDRVAEQASDNGKKIIQCLEDSEADIVAVPIAYIDGATKCYTDDVVKVVKSLGPLVQDLVSAQADAKAVVDNIDACEGDDIQGILCVVQVATDLWDIVAKLPETISGDLAPIKADLDKAIQDIVQCHKDQVEPFYTNAGQVADKIAACAAA